MQIRVCNGPMTHDIFQALFWRFYCSWFKSALCRVVHIFIWFPLYWSRTIKLQYYDQLVATRVAFIFSDVYLRCGRILFSIQPNNSVPKMAKPVSHNTIRHTHTQTTTRTWFRSVQLLCTYVLGTVPHYPIQSMKGLLISRQANGATKSIDWLRSTVGCYGHQPARIELRIMGIIIFDILYRTNGFSHMDKWRIALYC